jgi:hypothetical protein
VIIGKKRHDKRQTKEVIPKVSATSTLRGQDKIKSTGTASTGLTGAKTSLTGAKTSLTGAKTSLTGVQTGLTGA